jgi:ABC-type glycerol-3-phosphate transport system substrate-binding protein
MPIKQAGIPFHIWGSLVEKAGYKLSDAPKTWDAFHDFFKPVQDALRKQGMRKVCAMGMSLTTVGPNDGNGLFTYFVIANGGQNVVTPDGRLHTDDPQVREAFIRTVAYLTSAYKADYIPPDVLTWNDSDNNNGFHSKLFVMDLDGTISTELAMINDKQAFYHDSVTMGLPHGNDGRRTGPSQFLQHPGSDAGGWFKILFPLCRALQRSAGQSFGWRQTFAATPRPPAARARLPRAAPVRRVRPQPWQSRWARRSSSE